MWPQLEVAWPQLRGYAADWSVLPAEAFRVEAAAYYMPRMLELRLTIVLEHRHAYITPDEQAEARMRIRELVDDLGLDLARQVRDVTLAYIQQTAQDHPSTSAS